MRTGIGLIYVEGEVRDGFITGRAFFLMPSPSWFGEDFWVERPHMMQKIRRSAGSASALFGLVPAISGQLPVRFNLPRPHQALVALSPEASSRTLAQ